MQPGAGYLQEHTTIEIWPASTYSNNILAILVMESPSLTGLTLPSGSRFNHEAAALLKQPFPSLIPHLSLHELSSGQETAYRGQMGLIHFTQAHRLPRHVHIATGSDGSERLIAEQILVTGGVALVELNGTVYIVPPNTLTTIAPGVPHTWNACPPGIRLPDGSVSNGSFLMFYQYEEDTGFFPTDQFETFTSVDQYRRRPFQGDLERVRFPELTKEAVAKTSRLVWAHQLVDITLA